MIVYSDRTKMLMNIDFPVEKRLICCEDLKTRPLICRY